MGELELINKAKFSTWLVKIATNVYRDYLRKNKSFELVDENFIDRGKGVTAGFITVMITFFSATLINLNAIRKFIPYRLVEGANLFTLEGYLFTIVFSIICSIIFIVATVFRINKVEVI